MQDQEAFNREIYYMTALEFANRLRDRYGYGPLAGLPQGRCHSMTQCPLANTLPEASAVTHQGFFVDERWTPLPADVLEFVKAFDNGEYPELVIDEEREVVGVK